MIIKICGLRSQADVDAAENAGADLCGFIFHPQSPRRVSPETVKRIKNSRAKRVGVFVNHSADEIRAIMRYANLDYAQLHGAQSVGDAKAIGAERVIRVLWPEKSASPGAARDMIEKFADSCVWFLLDSGRGDGQNLRWEKLTAASPRPWLLAGGLNAINLPRALELCEPDGVDLNSGVESTPGQKDYAKIREAIKVARSLR